MMSSYDAFDAATAFVSYTTVTHQNFPSPPGSPHPVVSSTTSNFEHPNQPNFGDYYSPIIHGAQQQQSNQDLPMFNNVITMKTENGKLYVHLSYIHPYKDIFKLKNILAPYIVNVKVVIRTQL